VFVLVYVRHVCVDRMRVLRIAICCEFYSAICVIRMAVYVATPDSDLATRTNVVAPHMIVKPEPGLVPCRSSVVTIKVTTSQNCSRVQYGRLKPGKGRDIADDDKCSFHSGLITYRGIPDTARQW
jgi:hypothetical protein